MKLIKKTLACLIVSCIGITNYIQPASVDCPDDIAFCIADTKFDGKNLKILELGDSALSMFKGHDALYGRGSVWAAFWNYLTQFNIPIWFVGSHGKSMAVDVLERLGGKCVLSVTRLQGDVKLDMVARGIRRPKEHKGIVFVRRAYQRPYVEMMIKKFPSFVFVNEAAHNVVMNKYQTDKLFHDDKTLREFRPACKVCKKRYAPNLAQSIIDEIKSPVYVIKPTDGSRGRGIIFVTKDELDQTLKIILQDRAALRKMSKELPHTYGFWLFNRAERFLVEAYVPSKTVTVKGKEYDPTLRLVFSAHRMNGEITVDVHCAYWKLPGKALSEDGSLTEKHRSDVHSTALISSMKVAPEDLQKVKDLFCPMMAKVYKRMLNQQHQQLKKASPEITKKI